MRTLAVCLLVVVACGGLRASEPLSAASRLAGSPASREARALAPEEHRASRDALLAASK